MSSPSSAESRAPLRRRLVGVAIAVLAFVPAVAVAGTAWFRATLATFGRDQGIYHYVGWSLAQGARDYVDVREFNGPLIHVIHYLLLKIGGEDEHVFRLFDMVLSSAVFVAIGASLAGLASPPGRRVPAPERLAWGGVAWVVLATQYLNFGWWEHAQRESFYNLFLVSALAAQMLAHARAARAERYLSLLLVSGAIAGASWMGKPTNVLFSMAMVAAMALDKGIPRRRRAILAFVGAHAIGVLPFVAFVAAKGSLSAYVRVAYVEVPAMYRYIWWKSATELYSAYGNAPKMNQALATLVVAVVLAWRRVLPRWGLPALFSLFAAFVGYFVQGKGFPYHLHPIAAVSYLLWFLFALALVARARQLEIEPARARAAMVARWLSTALLVVLAGQSVLQLVDCPSMTATWYPDSRTAESRSGPAFYHHFDKGDFPAWDMREAARFVREWTPATEGVQTYGMDPYFLFLSKRLSASPYIYSFEFAVDAALQGGAGGRPNDATRAKIQSDALARDADMRATLERRAPAAFAIFDAPPFHYPPSGERDFEVHCPATYAWMKDRFTHVRQFGKVHVWLRNDLATRLGAP